MIRCKQPLMWESLKSERFDPFALWQRLGEDQNLLSELVEIFASEYPGMLSSIEESLQESDTAKLKATAHKLKGSLLQFGAAEASAAAFELETMAAAPLSLNGAADAVDRVKSEVDFLMRVLQDMLSQAQSATGNAPNEERSGCRRSSHRANR